MAHVLELLTPNSLPDRWNGIIPLVEKWLVTTQGEYILTDIYQYLSSGEWECWIVKDKGEPVAVALSVVTHFPRMKLLQVPCVAGSNMKAWLMLIEELEDWARMNGCKGIRGFGRRGWGKVLKSKGYGEQTMVTKVL